MVERLEPDADILAVHCLVLSSKWMAGQINARPKRLPLTR
jgi:hypothetical protein